MSSFQIIGGNSLSGQLSVSGSKNAVLPIVCATLLTDEQCVIKNVPDIIDVKNLIEILKSIGSKVQYENRTITIDNSGVNSFQPDPELVKKLRGSILLMGPLLARFGRANMPYPGGDLIGKRPIDTHLLAMRELGAEVVENGQIEVSVKNLHGNEVILNEMSVTATENTIMAAVCASGISQIHLAATEPHIQDLCKFLNSMGAKISQIGGHDLVIEGVEKLHGAEHTLIFDNEVACSFMNLAAATKSEITITGIQPQYLYAPLIQFRQMGVNLEVAEDHITVKKPLGAYRAAKIKTNIYPGLMSDYIPPFAVLATQSEGKSLIHEWMYEGRLGYIHELAKMGANARILDQHRAEIEGPCKLHGKNVSSLDVRSGMVMVIAALVAEGKSVLHDIEHVERGYEHVEEILKKLGANIERLE